VIPALEELKQLDHWVGWRFETVEGRLTKVPYVADNGRKAKSNDPNTWLTFEAASNAFRRAGHHGLGFVVTDEDPFVGIDLDHCRDATGDLEEWAQKIVDRVDSYTEITPSGTGVRIWIKAKKPGTDCEKGMGQDGRKVEIYESGRFFTTSGKHLAGTRTTMEDRQAELDRLYAELWPAKTAPAVTIVTTGGLNLTAYQVLELARQSKNAAKWDRLMNGDTSNYDGDDSRADAALCTLAAFYTDNPGTVDQIVRMSGLCRDKWTERQDYRDRTISGALELVTERYSPPDAGEVRTPAAEASDEPPVPYALTLDDFIACQLDSRPPLLGTEEDNLLPAGGMLVMVAKGGNGKTTATIDAALHLASGVEWLGFEVQRPLRILFVENEGPREPFRKKVAKKRAAWKHEVRGEVFIKTLDWGACTLADSAERTRLRDFIKQEQIDLVIGDPLDSLGIEGVGSPAETRAFMKLLVEVGLTRNVAFWLLHHPLKERGGEAPDELDQASGAWGGRPDTMLRLVQESGNRARLSFPKVRWGGVAKRGAYILAFDPDAEGFEVVAIEDGQERDLLAEIKLLLADGIWRTAREIAAPKKPKKEGALTGIGANDQTVKKILENNPDAFTSCNGKDLGRSSKATFWTALNPSAQLAQSTTSKGERGPTAHPPPFRGVGGDAVVVPPVAVPPAQLAQSSVAEVPI
jgi:hypothetical protein